jgi:hypothetical protein
MAQTERIGTPQVLEVKYGFNRQLKAWRKFPTFPEAKLISL